MSEHVTALIDAEVQALVRRGVCIAPIQILTEHRDQLDGLSKLLLTEREKLTGAQFEAFMKDENPDFI